MATLMTTTIGPIWVPGHPAPQGSKRHVGHGRLIEQSTRVAGWRTRISTTVHAYLPACYHADSSIPWHVAAVFVLPKPKTVNRQWPNRQGTGDLDKLLRALYDALTTSGAIHDDAQIVTTAAAKTYPTIHNPEPGVWITLTQSPEEPPTH